MIRKILGSSLIQIILMTALVLAGMLWPVAPWQYLENENYDFWVNYFRSPEDQPIAIVAIDEKSVAQLGDWPWPRSRIADMVRLLSAQETDALGICLLYTQPEENSGLAEIRTLKAQVADQKWRGGQKTIKILDGLLNSAEERLDHDAQLTSAVRRARNVVLPIRFTKQYQIAEENDKPSGMVIVNSLNAQELPSDTTESRIIVTNTINGERAPIDAAGVWETYSDLAAKAGALGHLNLQEDDDGMVRRVPLLVNYKGRLCPAFALQLALKHIGGQLRNLSIDLDFLGQPRLRIKHLTLATDSSYQMMLNYDSRWTQKRSYSFVDVLKGTVDPAVFRKKIVLIGPTAQETTQIYRVGSAAQASIVEITANTLARILSPVRLSRPSWGRILEIVALLYFAVFLMFVIPRVNIRIGASILAIFLVTWYALVVGLLLGYGYWVKMFGPVLLACCGFIMIQVFTYSQKRRQEIVEANKTLGLSYQGQGMLDMAYERYMLCPVHDPSVKNLLYSLALDFERKRMFNKALAIYQHIGTAGEFKDIKKRSQRLKPLDSTMTLTLSRSETPLMMDDTSTKPTFGRYEVLRELGHGSMGTVYLGRDPKINREVAIKTLEYSEVEPGELADVKARFFREAEAVGKFSHPNIVSIYDVGEEHDMAYIAMELLNGADLTHHCKPENLLPIRRALAIIADVTVALEYAHRQGVVHRDIKPANIMLLEDDRVKVTDFGIARVIDASQTQTGIILGTPSYMSPEQIAGKDLDGRSDLFSLGIVFYEMLTGTKPFKGETITATMYAITHNAHVPVSEIVPGIPACCEALVNKLLSKGVSKRFNNATQVSKAIENCRTEIK